jgi:hypothetical protein
MKSGWESSYFTQTNVTLDVRLVVPPDQQTPAVRAPHANLFIYLPRPSPFLHSILRLFYYNLNRSRTQPRTCLYPNQHIHPTNTQPHPPPSATMQFSVLSTVFLGLVATNVSALPVEDTNIPTSSSYGPAGAPCSSKRDTEIVANSTTDGVEDSANYLLRSVSPPLHRSPNTQEIIEADLNFAPTNRHAGALPTCPMGTAPSAPRVILVVPPARPLTR